MFKKIFRSLVYPPKCVVVAAPFAIIAMMVWVFVLENEKNLLSYVAYVCSFYLLVVFVVWVVSVSPVKRVRDLARRNRVADKVVNDEWFRKVVSVYSSIAVDVIWAVANLFLGACNQSFWLVTLGMYYSTLVIMRTLMLFGIRFEGERSLKGLMRASGVLIACTTFLVSGFVVLTHRGEGGFFYQEYVIYAIAAYAFFSLGTSLASFVSNRNHSRQIVFAISCVNLANAFVSLLAMEIAMLSVFGHDPAFEATMNAATGALVAFGNIIVGVVLFRRAANVA